jgi:hypothetical protein
VGPPRPGPLPKCPSMGKMTTDSTYEWRKIGEQVNPVGTAEFRLKLLDQVAGARCGYYLPDASR